jgi:hypothetical protein
VALGAAAAAPSSDPIEAAALAGTITYTSALVLMNKAGQVSEFLEKVKATHMAVAFACGLASAPFALVVHHFVHHEPITWIERSNPFENKNRAPINPSLR